MARPTLSGTVYGDSYATRLVRPENLRNPMLRRRGIFKRWYAAKDVAKLSEWVAGDIERREQHEQGLLASIQQLREENHDIKRELQRWQSERAREMWEAQHQL